MTSETTFVVQYQDAGESRFCDWTAAPTLDRAIEYEKVIRAQSRIAWRGKLRIIQRTITETELPPPAEVDGSGGEPK